MIMTFLGAGSAFTPPSGGNYQSNFLISDGFGKNLLIDCGTQVHMALAEQGMSAKDLDAVYVSHPHADHIGGMEELAFKTYFDPTVKRPALFANYRLMGDLWEHSLKGGLGSIQGKITTLDDYFEPHPVRKNGEFEWGGIKFRLVQVIHFMDGFDIVPSYGLMFTVGDLRYFITTDTQFAPAQIHDFYDQADIVFHDCETSPFKSGVHAHFDDLKLLHPDTKAKMWLYHYQPGALPDAAVSGFRGFASKGMRIDLTTGNVINQEASVSAMTEAQIKYMAEQFLRWQLPEDFYPDCGISFKKLANEGTPYEFKYDPSGTDLFDINQATDMVRHMVDGLPPK